MKQAGSVTPLCKRIVRDGSSDGTTEHELTALITAAAKRAQPDLSDEAAFTKMFTDISPAGEALRRAVAIARAGSLSAYPHPFPRI